MTTSKGTLLAGLVSVILGALVGALFMGENSEGKGRPEMSGETAGLSTSIIEVPRYRDLPSYLDDEFSYVNDLETFATKVAALHQSSLSPIRAHVVTSAYIENGSFEHWHEQIKNAEITGADLLLMVAAYLVREDAARAMEIMLNGPYDFQSFQDLLTFAEAIAREAGAVDPAAGFAELHKKESNLHRQVLAKSFSDSLARENPALAAERFSEILELRDDSQNRNKKFTRMLLESWRKTDQSAVEEYINGLPEGEVRELFEKAGFEAP